MKYYFANKRKTLAIMFIIVISVFCVYLVSTLVQSIFQTAEESNINALSQFSIVATTGNDLGIEEKTWDKLVQDETIGSVYSAYVESTYINNIFGQTTALMIFMSNNDLKLLFNKCNLTITEGRMPKADEYEIIIHQDMLKNRGLRLNEQFEANSGSYKIVGTYSGRGISAFGSKNHSVNQFAELGIDTSKIRFAGVIFPKSNIVQMNSMLDNINDPKIDISTATDVKRQFDEQTTSINLIMSIIIVIVIASISAAIGVVLSTVYSNRIDEFGILNAIGYNKKHIVRSVLAEVTMLISFSWIIGVIISIGMLSYVNNKIFAPMGQSMKIVSSISFLYTLLSIITIIVISVTPIVLKLARQDLIAVIERR